MNSTSHEDSGVRTVLLFEGSLIVVALGLGGLVGWWPGISLWDRMVPDPRSILPAVGRGIMATIPLLIGYLVLSRSRWLPLETLHRRMGHVVRDLLGTASVLKLALLSIFAGVGEEYLFRGVIQPLIAHWSTPLAGLIVASLLFGAAHSLTWMYFFLAALVGCYFGWLADLHNELITPAVAHALYDFIVIIWVIKKK